MAKKVLSLAHLKRLATNKRGHPQDFYLAIIEGIPCCSKRILYDPETTCFQIGSDDILLTEKYLTAEQLKETTHIVDAIETGTLYKY